MTNSSIIENRKSSMSFLLIGLTFVLSSFRSLFLYFWHDDFALFYTIKQGICNSAWPWPYNRYCFSYGELYKVFGYNPFPYFALGFLLIGATYFIVYIFCRRFLNKFASLSVSLLLSAGFIGATNLTYAYSIITIYLSLLVFVLSLYFLDFNRFKSLFVSILLFFISIVFFPARGSTYIFIYLSAIFLFFGYKTKTKFKLFFSFLALLVFLFVYFYLPYTETGKLFMVLGRSGYPGLSISFLSTKIQNFFGTISYFIFDERFKNLDPNRIFVGIGIFVYMFVSSILKFKQKKKFAWMIFSILWLVFLYIPQGLVTDWVLDSTNRYIIFPYIGFVLFLGGVLHGTKITKEKVFVTIFIFVLVVANLFRGNIYLKSVQVASNERRQFYSSLRSYIHSVPGDSVFFFTAPQKYMGQLADFMRVGFYPTETSISSELDFNMAKVKVVTESDLFTRMWRDGNVPSNRLYAFYWNGSKLIDTTEESRDLLAKNISRSNKIYLKSQKDEFVMTGFIPTIPTTMVLRLKADVHDFVPPLDKCTDCISADVGISHYLDFIRISEGLRNEVTIAATSSSEGTDPKSMTDVSFQDSYWLGERDWFEGVKPVITLSFKSSNLLDGIIIKGQSEVRKPKKVEVKLDGINVNTEMSTFKDGVIKVLFPKRRLKLIEIKIIETGGDRPSISDINLIPAGFGDIDPNLVQKVRISPVQHIETNSDKSALLALLKSGVTACVEWSSKSYGKGVIPFILHADGLERDYTFDLPSMGLDTPTIRVGCLDYPVTVHLDLVRYRFLSDNK